MTEQNTNHIDKKFWNYLWNILKPFKKIIIQLSFVVAFFEITKLVSPFMLKLIIDDINHFDPERLKHLLLLIALLFVSDSFSTLVHYFKDRRIFDFLIKIEYQLPITLQKKLVSLPLGYHERENTGNKIIKIQRGTEKMGELVVNFMWEFWPTVTNILFTFFSMLYFNWKISLVFIFYIPIFVWITYYMNKTLNPYRTRRHEEYENASGILGQSIINIYTVQSFVQELKETRKYENIRKHIKDISFKEFRYFLNLNLLRSFIVDLGRISVFLVSAYFAWTGSISLGTLVFFITLSETAYYAVFRISRTYDRLIESSTAVERITSLLNEKSDIENNPKVKIKNLKSKISFENITFKYHAGDRIEALSNVSFDVKPGETVALIGPSGGGKSTIVKLLYRHYDVTKGSIKVDDTDIRDYDLKDYRSHLAIVPQEVEIFNTTLKENIAYGNNQASFNEIKKVSCIANIDFIKNLEQGYDTLVGERGIRLSGGQRQRVGIARAILSKPSILIFDEATSNLDTHSEKLIQEAIERISKNQTMFIIAHRLSTVIGADKILVIDQGHLIEQGTHAELLSNKNSMYTHLLKLQAVGELK